MSGPPYSTVWTIGHSTRPLADFLTILAAYQIELVTDVRRYPGSRSQPQFQQAALESGLQTAGIGYAWLPGLGGRRRQVPNSENTAWRNPAFRGYADHIHSEEFAAGLFDLMMAAHGLRTAVMCAEIVWWRCHRRMIADVLVSLGYPVIHILHGGIAQPHRLAPPARLSGGVLSYAARQGAMSEE